jgi:hypothetical protein
MKRKKIFEMANKHMGTNTLDKMLYPENKTILEKILSMPK